MSHKKAISKAAVLILAALFALIVPLTVLAEPEYSTDGTCTGPGCHTEDELPDLLGHSGGGQPATEAPEIAQIEGAEYFTAAAKGFGGEVEVTIAVKDGQIAAMTAYGAKETQGIGSNAIEQLPENIVAAQSWEVDAVSGATVTSKAVKEAAKAAMIQAGLIEAEAEPTPAPVPETPTPTEAPVSSSAKEYTATAKGFGGDVEVTLGVEDGKIVSVVIIALNETPGIGSNAVEQLPQAIMDAQSWEVEAVSGATVSSMAIREAAKAAMTEAGLLEEEAVSPAPATEVEVEAPVEEETKSGGVDLVIIAIAAAFVVVAAVIMIVSYRRRD